MMLLDRVVRPFEEQEEEEVRKHQSKQPQVSLAECTFSSSFAPHSLNINQLFNF